MGDTSDPGRVTAGLTGSVRAAYDTATRSWSAGPEPVYAALAAALVAHVAASLAGARVLDLGAGTGVAGRAAHEVGAAEVVAADVAVAPLRQCEPPLRPVAADVAALPFRDDSFDLVLAAFSLTHAPDLGAALAQVRRVGRMLVSQRVRARLEPPGQSGCRHRAGPIRLPPAALVPDVQAANRAAPRRRAAGP